MRKKAKDKKVFKGKKIVKAKSVIIQGKYRFDDEEKKVISKELATRHVDMSIVEDEKKSIMSKYKDRLDRFKLDINVLSRCIIDGYEYRDFECYIEKDYDADIKRYMDVRTNEIIDERAMDPSDYQQEMDL